MDETAGRTWGIVLMVNGAILLVVVLVAMVANVRPVFAADPANYDVEYSVTNFYTTNGGVIYHFTNLDPATQYVWLLQGIDENAIGFQALGMKQFSGGATATITWQWGLGDFDRGDGTAYTGAARVVDSFGNEVGRHYLYSGCGSTAGQACVIYDWPAAGGVNAQDHRIGIGLRFHQLARNTDGWFHPYKDASAVLTKQGETTILHYRFDPAIIPTTDEYRIYELATGDLMYTFALQDLYEYNDDDRRSILGVSTQAKSFVVLSTNGVLPAFINHAENATAWGNGDNPHTAYFDVGAYDYERTNAAGANVDDGESVFLVGVANTEWNIRNSQDNIGESQIMRLELETYSEGIWSSGYLDHELDDSLMGNLDSADYAYQLRRSDTFTVFGVSTDDVVVTWGIFPTLTNMTTAILAERRFEVDFTYAISNFISPQDRIESTLNGLGMDTPLGRGIALLVVMLGVMLLAAKRGAKGLVPFALIFLFVGGAWLTVGLGDGLTAVLFAISAVVVLFMLVNNRRKDQGFSG